MGDVGLERLTLAIAILAAALSIAATDGQRLHSLSQQMKCDCGCGDVLGECEHADCKRRPLLKKEISDSISQGATDKQVLKQMSAVHGPAILLTPLFQGFNSLLWIVPVGIAILALALTVYRFRKIGPPGSGT